MNNEQLASLIQTGNAPELLPILWERTKRYLYKLAGRAYSAYKESCDRAGIVMDDLRQGCYEAFLQAVGAYKPESGFAFLSFTAYPFKNVLHSMLGIRTRRRDPLNECSSLDAPADPEGESTFLELLPDPDGTAHLYRPGGAGGCRRRACRCRAPEKPCTAPCNMLV